MDALKRLKAIDSGIYHLERVVALLGWEQETFLPDLAIEGLSEQLPALEAVIHRKSTSAEIGECLSETRSKYHGIYGV